MTKLSLFLFGAPRIEQDGVPIQVDTRKATALISYLAITRQQHSRQHLAKFFWGESDTAHARAALRRTLSVLNKALSGNWLQITSEMVGLDLEGGIWLDVAEFSRCLENCQKHGHPRHQVCSECHRCLATAVQLYQGDFLAGFRLSDSPAFDDWQFLQAEALQRDLEESLEKLSRYHHERGEFEQAIPYTRQWCERDPLQEAAHCRLMELYTATHQLTAVHRQYQKCVDILDQQLGITPQPETTELYHRLTRSASRRNGKTSPADSSTIVQGIPTLLVSQRQRHNLPPRQTPCMGRAESLQEITTRLLDPFCRLLTVSGPGGVGKTRLALEVAYRLLETADFQHPIFFVPLAAVHSTDLLVSALTQTLYIPLSGREDVKHQLLQYLQHKELLLVLDNFEHLLPNSSLILEILQSAPKIKLLVTSRECLNFHAEWLFELEGLNYPTTPYPSQKSDFNEVVHLYSAVELFLYNTSRIRPNFRPTASDLSMIIRICRFVSGFPLGIELAATLMSRLSLHRIADDLDHNLDLLSTTLPDIPERHRSLRTIFEFSWSLLTPLEQNCLKCLAIFQGTFGHEAAQYVANASPGLLARLSDKSLLRTVSSRSYGMHELIRQFTLEKLQLDTDMLVETEQQHARYFARLVHESESHLKDARQKKAIELIGKEIEEIRVAWEWAVKHQRPLELEHLLEGLYTFYEISGWFQEGEEMFQKAADRWQATSEPDKYQEYLLPKLRAYQASFVHRLARYEEAKNMLENSLLAFRHLNKLPELLFCLHQLGIIGYFSGNYLQAKTHLSEGLTLAQTLEDEWNLGHSFNSLGNVFLAIGHYPEARQYFQTSLMIRRSIGDQRGIAVSLNNLGRIAEALEENLEEAQQLFRESISIKQKLGDRRGAVLSSMNLGYVLYLLGELAEAEQLFRESLTVFREMGEPLGIARALTNLGNIAYGSEQYLEAEKLYEESLLISTEAGDKQGIIFSLNDLGKVALASECYEESRAYFCDALKVAYKIQAVPLASEALVGLATYQVQQNQIHAAMELICFIQQLSTNDKETSGQAEELYSQLAPLFSQAAIGKLHEEAKHQTLEQVIVKMLSTYDS